MPKKNQPNMPEHAADLTNCDREPIHIPGRVQSFGALLSASADLIVNHASSNISEFVNLSAKDLVGRPLTDCLTSDALREIQLKLQRLGSNDTVERLFGIDLTGSGELFDTAIHISGQSVIIEIERHDQLAHNDHTSQVRPMIDRIATTETVEMLCDTAARHLRALVGFGRVMVYKFNEDGTGTVLAESLKTGMESYKGLRYPASDIPKQARALYKRNLLRIISDVADTGHEIVPVTNSEGEPLDLSLSTTRAVSQVHLEYLRNMGVQASMSISIMRRGELWGLFACHNDAPKILSYGQRTAADLFGQLFSYILDQKESDAARAETMRARILHDQLMAQLADDAGIAENFEAIVSAIGGVIPFDGVVGWVDGQFISKGSTPDADAFRKLAKFLNTTPAGQIYARRNLLEVYAPAEAFSEQAAGLLVLPVSRAPRDYIVLFRREVEQSVTWAGNPEKPVEPGADSNRLNPRKSFEAWKQVVRHQSTPWTDGEIAAANALRMTMLEVVLRMSDASNRERAKSQERQELLIAELNHRVRNILNLIRGLISQTQSDGRSVAQFTEVIGGRIHALARAHDQITKENWTPASLHALIRTETEAYLGSHAHRVVIRGDEPLLEPVAFTTLSLVVHELVTNSAKYGALCDRSGSIEIGLTKETDGGLQMTWREMGGPPIRSQPTRRGFGSAIIERSVPYELKGHAAVRYKVTGLEADFTIPAAHVAGIIAEGASVPTEPSQRHADARLSGDVLVLEDNMIIAMDAEMFLEELGANKVHTAASVAEALGIIEAENISFALLDVNLGDETSEPVARRLREVGIAFVLATGYGDTTSIANSFPGVAIIQKPFDISSIAASL